MEVRQRFLQRQEKVMRVCTQGASSNTGENFILYHSHVHMYNTSTHHTIQYNSAATLCVSHSAGSTPNSQHRSLVFWHDHSTILNHGFLMVTLRTLFDKDVYVTNKEYLTKQESTWISRQKLSSLRYTFSWWGVHPWMTKQPSLQTG